MPSDREDLRQRVNELEATVRGLTQELVEANERIRTLEEGDADKPMPDKGEESKEETESATEEQQDDEDDIIVA